MVEQFIKAIRHIRDNVQPGYYSVSAKVKVHCNEELLNILKITGWSDHKYLKECKVHIIYVGPHIQISCEFNPSAALYHGSVMPHQTERCLEDPAAAAGLLFGVVGFEKFNNIQNHISCYFLTPERAVELAGDLSFCGETVKEEKNGTKWLEVGPFIALFLLQENDIVLQS